MPVNYATPAPEALFPVAGVRLGTAEAGIRKKDRRDLTLVELAPGSRAAGVFTQNRCCAAPVTLCREHLAGDGSLRALVINTGIANAATGEQGMRAARETCDAVASLLGCKAREVLPFSTGVILEHLPVERLVAGLPAAKADLSADHWHAAAHAIMTTDTVAKAASRRIELGGKTITVTGISKGAGMIRPNMATMLGFVATDAGIPSGLLALLAKEAADQSFNCITVDGDTSTNDSFVVIATGASGLEVDATSPHWPALRAAVFAVAQELAQAIVRDGEGATKLVKVIVDGAASDASAKIIARTISESPLVKTAIAGEDANWGRIVAAAGRSDQPLKREMLSVRFGDLYAARDGMASADYDESAMSAYMKRDELEIAVTVGPGAGRAVMWTCDLTKRYVEINGDYRS